MKILVVVHNFLPNHAAGGELYTYRIAKELASTHDVLIYCTEHQLFRRNYTRREYQFDGLNVVEITNHRHYGNFADSYADRAMESHFKRVLKEFTPDLIHFQHILHHSVGYAETAREVGIPTVMTLHEYWLLCARNGQMIQESEERCERPGLDKCSKCMSHFMWGRKRVDVWVLRGIAALKSVTGVDLRATARQIRITQHNKTPQNQDIEATMQKLLVVREARMRDLYAQVDMFIAPSHYLRERFIEHGFDAEHIIYSDYGTATELFEPAEIRMVGPLRIGCLSSVQPVKGIHVLVEALQRLDSRTYTAVIHGDTTAKPEYVRQLREMAPTSVTISGPIRPADVPEILKRLDVLVVPSIWWENSPLVIHEAFAAKIPVVASGIGGMAELVRHGRSGLLFTPGNAGDLALQLRALIENRELLKRLRDGIPVQKTIQEDAAFLNELFTAVIHSYS